MEENVVSNAINLSDLLIDHNSREYPQRYTNELRDSLRSCQRQQKYNLELRKDDHKYIGTTHTRRSKSYIEKEKEKSHLEECRNNDFIHELEQSIT